MNTKGRKQGRSSRVVALRKSGGAKADTSQLKGALIYRVTHNPWVGSSVSTRHAIAGFFDLDEPELEIIQINQYGTKPALRVKVGALGAR